MVLTVLFFLLGFVNEVHSSVDPCHAFKLLNEPHRSTAFIPESTDRLICDRALTPGWYRFGTGEDMPTSCVNTFHCGTNAPIWLNGTLPSINDGVVNREACINYGLSAAVFGGMKCCNAKVSIRIKNCGQFRVYYLQRLPGCSMAYCAGSKRVCSLGTINQGTNTCHDLYPKMTEFPVLDRPTVDANNDVIFKCHVKYPTGEADARFDVTWTVDDHVLMDPQTGKPLTSNLAGDQRTALLNARYLQGHLGKTVRCNVTSHYVNTPGVKSDMIKSQGFWAGIRLSHSSVVADEKGNEQEIEMESTLPIPCNNANKQTCTLSVEMQSSTDPNDLSTTSCVFELKYDPNTHTYKAPIKIKATRDFINDKNKNHVLSFRPMFNFNQPMWMGYKIQSVQVRTEDRKHGLCQANGDPHFRQLDYKGRMDVYKVGDLVMYKSKVRPFEVQIRTWSCGRYHPCICALVAREGNDVVQVDMCARRKNQIAAPDVKVLSQGRLDGTTIDRDPSGKVFFINFPSGARVKVRAAVGHPVKTERDGYLGVEIQAPTDDIDNAEGLCGSFDGNENNDFMGADNRQYDVKHKTDFINTWIADNASNIEVGKRFSYRENDCPLTRRRGRSCDCLRCLEGVIEENPVNNLNYTEALKPGSSLFDSSNVPPHEARYERNEHFCACKNGTADCTKGDGANNPSKPVCNNKCTAVQAPNVHPRDLGYSDDFPDRYVPDERRNIRSVTTLKRRSTWPTPSGITEAQAIQKCTSDIKGSNLAGRCGHMADPPMQHYIDACVEDMMYADGDMFNMGHMNMYDSACQDVVLRNVSNYSVGPDGELIPPLDVTGHVCPNQCSRQGTCVQGWCNCNHGLTSADCSVPIGVDLVIDNLRGDGVCDVRTRPCRSVNVIAENILDTPELVCRYQSIEIINGTEHPSGYYVQAPATYKSFVEVECKLPTSNVHNNEGTTGGFLISISNNGQNFSQDEKFEIYDGKCQRCDPITKQCTLKSNACDIEGQCRLNGEQNEDHQLCKSSASQYQWTSVPGIGEIDHYTASATGCPCEFDHTRFDCACCKNDGCQCGKGQQGQCADCNHLDQCLTHTIVA